ncbi:MAG: hypothetical protein P8X39_01570 [Desulfofustis sp.]
MTRKQRPSLPSLIVRAPFFAGFLVLLFFIGSSLFSRIQGFAAALDFSAMALRFSTYALLALFVVLCILVLVGYLSGND